MAVVKVMILFGSKMLVVTPQLEKALTVFNHRAVWRMTGIGPKRQLDGTGVYPPIGSEMEMVGLYEIGAYISRRQNTVAKYIATRPIMESCLAAERRTGKRLSRRWWEQTTLYILGIIMGHAVAEMGEETGMEELDGEID